MIEITLPYPPSVNHYKAVGQLRTTSSGKMYQPRYNSPETKRYYYEVFMKCRQEGVRVYPGSTILDVSVGMYPPDHRKRDIDGILKVLLDSLQKANVYEDDYQISRLTITRYETIKHGQIIVRIKEYSP